MTSKYFLRKKNLFYFFILLFVGCSKNTEEKQINISSGLVNEITDSISVMCSEKKKNIERGIYQVAQLWREEDGNKEEFRSFCINNYIADEASKEAAFLKISEYLEAINGHYNQMSLALLKNIQEETGPISKVDELFSAYNPATHVEEDLYRNKLAFFIALNFPKMTLEEKEEMGNKRLQLAYARLGDMYTSRIPAEIKQNYSETENQIELYANNYNIYAGHLLDLNGNKIFPEDMILLSHWNLRDEIKANYNKEDLGLDKQHTIYKVMQRIILQEIPVKVINSGQYDWNPYTNEVFQNGNITSNDPENNQRYENLLKMFHAVKSMDKYCGNTFMERSFSENMEISLEETESLLKEYLSSSELKKIGNIIQNRLGRNLQAFDIWYDGFKPRSNLDEEKLSELTRKLYPDAEALEKNLSEILVKLGFNTEKACSIASKIEVDAARGSGHAWGAAMKGQKSHLRTRIPPAGMDYKGYNIAIHEFGHNVEQTISLYDVDYYLLNGVPNTSFTEALAFVFQKRDLDILGIKDKNPEKDKMEVLDKAWQLYEIGGVSLLDISIWKWMYNNPHATATQLKDATVTLAKEIWNEYYFPVFGIKDEPVLAIYTHMLNYPLYLSAYSFGQIIQFQLEQHLKNKNFASEVERIYRLGRLTPNQWMIQATGNHLSVEPLLKAIREME